MTKQEIIDKINAGIRGQGSQVDIGGVLGDILDSIVGLLPTETPTRAYLTVRIPYDGFRDLDTEEAAEILNIPVNDLLKLRSGEIPSVIEYGTYNSFLVTAREDGYIFLSRGDATGFGGVYFLRVSDGKWMFSEV